MLTLTLVVALAAALPSLALAEPSGLSGAIERQRQDAVRQQGEIRREIERQGRTLQQQQEQNLQFELLRRQQPVPPPRLPSCTQVGATVHCQ